MLKLLLCLKYLRRCKIVFLSVAAVAISVALLVVVSSLFSGFIDAFGTASAQVLGDVLITPTRPIAKADELIWHLERSDSISAAAASISVPGLVRLGTGNVRQTEVRGINAQAMARVTGLRDFLDQQGMDPNLTLKPEEDGRLEAYAGIGLLVDPNEITDEYDWQAARDQLGSSMLLFTGSLKESTSDPNGGGPSVQRQTLRLRLSDIAFSGFYLLDSSVIFVPLKPLYRQLHPDQDEIHVDRIHIKLEPGVDALSAIHEIREIYQDFAQRVLGQDSMQTRSTSIVTSRVLQEEYLSEVNRQMEVLLAVFGIVDVAVVFLVFCVFWLIVGLKRKDIAVLKSCGASGLTVAGIFLGFGAWVGLVGALLGVGIGVLFMHHINAIEQILCQIMGLKIWSSSLYMLHDIPHQFDTAGAIGIAIIAIVAASVGALIPAWVAACTRPVRILRYE